MLRPTLHLLILLLVAVVPCGATAQEAPSLPPSPVQSPSPPSPSPSAWDSLARPWFSHLTAAEGLPYTIALSLAQDDEGYLWFGTPGGLARWDGIRMTVFRQDNDAPGSLPESIIQALLVDRGQLWVGTLSGLVARYQPRTATFETFRDEGTGLGRLYGLEGDGAGGVWAVGQFGLAHLDPGTGQWRQDDLATLGLPPGPLVAIRRDRDGGLWLGSPNGLWVRPPGGTRFDPVRTEGLPSPLSVSTLYQDKTGTLWFGTSGGVVGRVERTPADRRAVPLPAIKADGQRISAIAEARPGRLWIATVGNGIREVDLGSGAVRQFRHSAGSTGSLTDDSVTGLLVDRSGLLWAITPGGVDRTDPRNDGIVTLLPEASDDKMPGLPGRNVRSMAVRPDGKVWLGFRSDGMALLDPAADRLSHIPPDQAHGLPKAIIQAMAVLPSGQTWIGCSNGLYSMTATGGGVMPFTPLAGANITALRAEPPWLWVGGGMGLARINTESGEVRVFRAEPRRADSLSDNSVVSLLRDRKGRLWVGTQRGLNRMDGDDDRFVRYLHRPGDAGSLPNDVIDALLEDADGRLWVGTGNGIAIMHPDQDGGRVVRHLNRVDGMPHDTITVLLEDLNGMVWAGTGDGVARIDPRTLAVRSLGMADGGGLRTTWVGSGGRLPDGTLLMGGLGGLTVIRPDRVVDWTFRPPVVVTALRVGGQPRPVPLSGAGTAVSITPEDRSVEVDFAALDFSAPDSNRYRYRLDSFDGAWVNASADRPTATYTNLPPGHYRLRLQGSNRLGEWTEPPTTLMLHVLPAWYQTTAFRAILVLTGIVAVGGIIQGRTAYLRRRQRELEERVAQRTTELEAARQLALAREKEAHRAREDAEAANRAKSRFLAVASHEIRTPLNGVLGMLQLLDPRGLAPQQKTYLEIAQQSGANLVRLIESILEYSRQEVEGDTLDSEDFDPRQLVAEAVDVFRPQAEAKGVMLTLATPGSLPPMVHGDSIRLGRILHNLLGNAVKFTAQGRITVTLDVASPDAAASARLDLAVADTGIGIAPEQQEAVFGDFVQADDSIARQYGGTGLGLALCRRAAHLMGGTLTLNSIPGVGSMFRLSVPVGLTVPAAGEALPATAPRPAEASAVPPLSVLLVDDDEINRRVGAGLLARLGQTVTQVDGGEAAVRAVAKGAFDLVLMDVHMPVVDGLEACRRIRALPDPARAGVRVVAVTADLTRQTREDCQAVGMERIITKPLRQEVLRAVLAAAPAESVTPQPWAEGEGWVDMPYLRGQWEILGSRDMLRLWRLFHRVTPPMLADIAAAGARGDLLAARATVHRLGGSADALGLSRLATHCTALEQAVDKAVVQGGAGTEARELIDALPEVYRRSTTMLRAMVRARRARG